MRNGKVDFLSALVIILTVIILAASLLFMTGCAEKTVVVTKYKYIEKQCPRLTVYKDWNKTLNLTAYNKNGKICINEWGGCISKDAFMNLAKYINDIKTDCKKYQNEIILYNNKFSEPRNSKSTETSK